MKSFISKASKLPLVVLTNKFQVQGDSLTLWTVYDADTHNSHSKKKKKPNTMFNMLQSYKQYESCFVAAIIWNAYYKDSHRHAHNFSHVQKWQIINGKQKGSCLQYKEPYAETMKGITTVECSPSLSEIVSRGGTCTVPAAVFVEIDSPTTSEMLINCQRHEKSIQLALNCHVLPLQSTYGEVVKIPFAESIFRTRIS